MNIPDGGVVSPLCAPRKLVCPSLSCKITSQLRNTFLILYRKGLFRQERASVGQEGLINVQAPSGLGPCLQGFMQCPAEISSTKLRKGSVPPDSVSCSLS